MNIFIDPLLFLQYLREITGGFLDSFFLSCTFYGELTTAVLLMAIVYWCVDKDFGEYLLVSFASSNLVASFAKICACIYRPWVLDSRVKPITDALETATGYSFTSGHTTNATVIFGGAAVGVGLGTFSAIYIISHV